MTAANRPIVQAKGEELQALLSPVTPQEFIRQYWARRPLFVKGYREKYHGLFDLRAFSEAISGAGPFPQDFIRASFDKKTGTGTSAAPRLSGDLASAAFRAAPEQAAALYEAGATLCVSQIETRISHVPSFLDAIKRQLGYPGKVSFNAYLSPAGSGFNWHFDSRIASTLQIEGSKRWRYSKEPVIAWPRSNGSLRGDGTPQYTDPGVRVQDWERLQAVDEHDVDDVLLEPGDLLILPAGTWHEACGGEGGSLALNLSFTPIPQTVFLAKLLDELLVSDERWRGPSPGVEAFAQMVKLAAQSLSALSPDDPRIVKTWQSFVQSSAPLGPVETGPVQPDERLRVRADGNFVVTPCEGGRVLSITVGPNRHIELTGSAMSFVSRILQEREFSARDSTAWGAAGTAFEWADVANLLTSLKREGLIEPA
jgi:ribosomal protein L16 Arg81 hydroxylase